MVRRRLIWQLYPLFLAALVLALAVVSFVSLRSFGRLLERQTRSELESTARVMHTMLSALPSMADAPAVQMLCRKAGEDTGKRITIILPPGEVAADSERDSHLMESHADRPEVRQALAGGVGIATRYSSTLNREMMYVALPHEEGGRVVAVVRTAMPMRVLTDLLTPLDRTIALEGLAVALLAAAVVLLFSRRFMRPLEEIRLGAQRFLEGDLSYRLRVRGPAEVASLAETMNRMAEELSAHMAHLKQLEDLRREFVANVSHELKTPVTSIRGFAETLRDGALDDPARAKPFLEIIAAHSARLATIIEDLLQLSRIEQAGEGGQAIAIERGPLRPALESAIEVCAASAAEKRIDLRLSCGEELAADINAPLLEQAVVNLVDNAIKYSGEGSSVDIEAAAAGGEVRVAVCDRGEGIPTEHLSRIFERFYRIDKGRSRAKGGTGLGLAIVKHIAQLHGGRVTVESAVGEGSTFTVIFPIDAAKEGG